MDHKVDIKPHDEHNEKLITSVHPADWQNPEPAPLYNLAVIGAGPAGLVAAAGAAGLGAKVALVERHLMGGDCLNVGCVPSKSIIKSSRTAAAISSSASFGMEEHSPAPDFQKVMERLRRIRADIAHHDSAERFSELGIDVFLGTGTFATTDTIEVGGKHIRFKKAVIATGARASVPDVEGLEDCGFLTNESLFELTELPGRLAVYGAGPIGCELAQAFSRLGSEVTMIVRSRLCSKEEPDASDLLLERFTAEGIRVIQGAVLKSASNKSGTIFLTIQQGRETSELECDELLVALGRTPNVNGLGLESAGIEFDFRKGVQVNDRLQTTNSSVFAAGDVCMSRKFTHAADAAARIVIQNALFMGRKKLSSLIIPRCTYTEPEIASVGMLETEADTAEIETDIYKIDISELDRAQTDSETDGFIKVITARGSDRILGATIASSHAGELISEITAAMQGGTGLGELGNVIHPYPTQSEIVKRVADAYNRTRLSPTIASLFRSWFKWNLR
jgi:pyruvate/2-oxoglutarate dehydrogenase complex dihydrolipoamide dehydrogenase (E3) component